MSTALVILNYRTIAPQSIAATAYVNILRNTCVVSRPPHLKGGARAQNNCTAEHCSHSICQHSEKHVCCQQAASLEGGARAQGDDVGAAISHRHSEGYRLKDGCVH